MKSCLSLVLLLLCNVPGIGQNTDSVHTYFDKEWRVTLEPAKVMFFRTVGSREGKFLVRDYFASTQRLRMEAVCKEIKPQLIFDGKAIWYHENGRVKKEMLYVDNRPVGMVREYYDNGSPMTTVFYKKDEKARYHQHWSPEGQPILNRGTGFIVSSQDGGAAGYSVTEVVDSIMVSSFSVKNDGDTIYSVTEKAAEYRGGIQKFYKDIGGTLLYPQEARRYGVEGKVFIELLIDKNGEVSESFVLKGIGSGCDEAAVKAVRKTGKWNPATHHGKPVKARFVVPIVFKLVG